MTPRFQTWLLKLGQHFGLLPQKLIPMPQVDYHTAIETHLDAYRELISDVEEKTQLFSQGPAWRVAQAQELDDFLLTLYQINTQRRTFPTGLLYTQGLKFWSGRTK